MTCFSPSLVRQSKDFAYQNNKKKRDREKNEANWKEDISQIFPPPPPTTPSFCCSLFKCNEEKTSPFAFTFDLSYMIINQDDLNVSLSLLFMILVFSTIVFINAYPPPHPTPHALFYDKEYSVFIILYPLEEVQTTQSI